MIEHVVSPVELINAAKLYLKDDGIIVVFTPQFDSVAIQTLKEYSNLVMPAEHLSYFTEGTVKYLAEKCGMKVDYYATKGIDIGDLKGYYDYLGEYDKANHIGAMYDILQPTIDQSGAGNHMRFILSNK